MTKGQLAETIYDALKSTNTMDYVDYEDGDLSSVVIDGRFDLLKVAEAVLKAAAEPPETVEVEFPRPGDTVLRCLACGLPVNRNERLAQEESPAEHNEKDSRA